MSINQPAFIMIFAAIISLLLSVYAWIKRQNSAGIFLSFLLLSASVWALFYGLEIFSSNFQIMKIYLFISYFGIACLPVFWFLFAARYSGIDLWINPFTVLLLFFIPVITILMVATNQYHHVFYTTFSVGTEGGYSYLKLESGPFWWLNIIYSHLLIISGFIFFVRLFFKVNQGQRIHIIFFMGSAFLPYIVNILYVSGFRPYGFLDLTPVAFIVMGVIVSFGVFAVKLFDLNPLAVDLFFKNTQDAIFVRNTKGIIVNANPAAQLLLESISITEIFNKNSENGIISNTRSFNETPEVSELKIYQKYYEKTNTRIFSSNGKAIGTLTILRENTKAKEAQEEIKKLANLQHLLMKMASNYINLKIDDMEEGIQQSLQEMGVFADADRAYIFEYDWQKNTCTNTYEWCADGISKEIENLKDIPVSMMPNWVETHRKGESLIVPDIYILSKEDSIRKILEPQGIKSLITIPIMHKNHCHGFIGFDFVKRYHFINDNEHTLLSVYAEILVNLLKRALLEKNLIKEKENANAANNAKSEFLANMSHEIRTPMNSILGFAEVLLNTTSDKQQKTYLNTILDSGKTLLSLINDILDLSKIEAGRMEITAEPTDLTSMINEMEHLFYHKMKENNIGFEVEIDKKFPKAIIIDDLRIRQILLNLIGNAVKFTSDGYVKVKVVVLHKDDKAVDFEIRIIDTGIGIAGDDYHYLFEAFSQQFGQNSRKYGGTGLGLAITKRLVELMNGKISIESELGKGSCFTICFTDVKSAELILVKKEGFEWSEKNIAFKPAKILVVDDIPHNRTLVLTFLSIHNFSLIEAENGEEAVEIALNLVPDLIFMDIRMPRMDGYEAAKIIKSNEKTAQIPIIALTASTMQSDLEKVKEHFDGYIRKPVQKKMLINELVKHLTFEEQKSSSLQVAEKMDEKQIPENTVITPELKHLFVSELSNDILNHNDSIIIDDVAALVVKLEEFALLHNIEQLKSITPDLKSYLEEFDFDSIQRCLSLIKNMFRE